MAAQNPEAATLIVCPDIQHLSDKYWVTTHLIMAPESVASVVAGAESSWKQLIQDKAFQGQAPGWALGPHPLPPSSLKRL